MKQPLPDFVIRGASCYMEEDPAKDWRTRVLFFGPTSVLDELHVHAGLLRGFVCPHPPHSHEHEELHIALSENLEFVFRDSDSQLEKAFPVEKGSLFYNDAELAHTIRNSASEPAAYLFARWKNRTRTYPSEIRKNFYYYPSSSRDNFRRSTGEGTETIEIYSGPSRYLPRLRALFTKVLAGGRIPFHRHAHEVIFMFLSGSVEILGRKLDAPGFAFMGSQVPHYIVNPGPEPAEYYAFELHGEA